jgi:O-antigen/teichoic acid export membrane protein
MQQQASDSTFKPALMLMTGRALAFAVTFFVPVILVRVFNQAEFGTYKQFILITSTLFAFGQFGLAECLFYFLPGNPERAGRYVCNSVVMLGIMGVLFSTVLLLNSARVAEWLNNDLLAAYAPLAALYVIFMLMGAVLEITMINRKDFRAATATYVTSDLLRAALLIVPALITGRLEWTFIGGITFCVLRVVAVFRYLHKKLGPDVRFDPVLLRQQFAYAFPFFCSVIVQIIHSNYHQYAVSWYTDAATFAIYSVGCLQIPLVDFMATPAANVMMVQMRENLQNGRPERLLAIFRETTRKLAFVFFPLVGLLIVNAYHLITLLYTTAYASSVPIFMVWSLYILFAAFQTDGALRTFAQNKTLFIISVVRLCTVLALMSWSFSTFSLMGPVLLTIIGIFTAKCIALYRLRTLLDTSFVALLPWKTLGGVALATVLSAVPSAILSAKLHVTSIVLLPISGMAFVITFGILVVTLGLLDEGEKAALKRMLYVWQRRPVPAAAREAGVGR